MNTTQLQTVKNITVDYVDSHYTLADLMGLIEQETDLVVKSVAESMNTDKIYIENNSQGYYESRHSDHSVDRIDNLSEIIPLMIADRPDLLKIWNNGIDDDGEMFTSTHINDIVSCYNGNELDESLYDFISYKVESIADDIVDDLIKRVKDADEQDYQDSYNSQAFREFCDVNSIEGVDGLRDYHYINRDKGYTHDQLIADGYTQITDDYQDLYVKLPELVEHTRQTIDDGVITNTQTFYTFM